MVAAPVVAFKMLNEKFAMLRVAAVGRVSVPLLAPVQITQFPASELTMLSVVVATARAPTCPKLTQFALPFAAIPITNPEEHCEGVAANAVAVAALPVVFWFQVGAVPVRAL